MSEFTTDNFNSSQSSLEYDFSYNVKTVETARTRFENIDTNISVREGYRNEDYDYFRRDEQSPVAQKKIIQECNWAYHSVGIIRTIVDLMSDFCVKGIQLNHPGEKEQEFYREWFKKANLSERSERFCNYLFRLGNVVVNRTEGFVSRTTDMRNNKVLEAAETKTIPIRYTFLNIKNLEFVNEDISIFTNKPVFRMGISATLKRLIKNAKTETELNLINELPKELLNSLSAQKQIILDPNYNFFYAYKKDDWLGWAVPLLFPILTDIKLLQKIKLADKSSLDGAICHVRHWKIGSLDKDSRIIPTQAAIDRLHGMLLANVGGGSFDLITGPEVAMSESSSDLSDFLGKEKYEPVLEAIYSGLGIPPSLIGASSDTSTNNYLSLKTLAERIAYVRTILVNFLSQEIKFVQKSMGFAEPAVISFEQMVLTDEASMMKLMIELYDRNLLSGEGTREKFNISNGVESSRLNRENNTMDKLGPFVNSQQTHELKKNYTQNVAPSEVGLKLEPRKAGEKSPAEMKAESPQGNFSAKPPGVNGRPKGQKDSKKRKPRKFSIKTTAETINWADKTQTLVHNFVKAKTLKTLFKKTLRELTEIESETFELDKFKTLWGIEPMVKVTDQILELAYNSRESVADSILSKREIALASAETVEDIKSTNSLVYSMYKPGEKQ